MQKAAKIEKLNILLIEDSETDAYAVKRALKKHMGHPCRVQHATSMAAAKKILKDQNDIELILLDLGLPDTTGSEDTFKHINGVKDQIPVIILTSVHDHDLAVNMVDEGAEDYVKKSSLSADPVIICDAIDFAVCRHRNIEALKEQAKKEMAEKDNVINWMSGSYSVSNPDADK